jgi:acyl carrier protein
VPIQPTEATEDQYSRSPAPVHRAERNNATSEGNVESDIAAELRNFIATAFLFGDRTRMPDDTASLLETGVLDSTGVLELIEYLEDQFRISVADTETVPENLGSIAGLTKYVLSKIDAAAAGAA